MASSTPLLHTVPLTVLPHLLSHMSCRCVLAALVYTYVVPSKLNHPAPALSHFRVQHHQRLHASNHTLVPHPLHHAINLVCLHNVPHSCIRKWCTHVMCLGSKYTWELILVWNDVQFYLHGPAFSKSPITCQHTSWLVWSALVVHMPQSWQSRASNRSLRDGRNCGHCNIAGTGMVSNAKEKIMISLERGHTGRCRCRLDLAIWV